MKIVSFGFHTKPNRGKFLSGRAGVDRKKGVVSGEYVNIVPGRFIVLRSNYHNGNKQFGECKIPLFVRRMIFEKYELVGAKWVEKKPKKEKEEFSVWDTVKRVG